MHRPRHPGQPGGGVLMVLGHDPLNPDAPYWFSIGGGIEPGESEQQAAAHELWEETGIDRPATELGEPVHRDEHNYVYNGVEVHANSVFFVLALQEDVVVRRGAGEIITDSRWWYPDALTREPLSNPDLPEIVSRAVRSL
ncbi:MAG: NUDIX domain-containing protein [Nakamurella sp.]